MTAELESTRAEATELFARLGDLLYGVDDYQGAYRAVCVAARLLVTGCDHASLMMREGDDWSTPAATDDVAREVDLLERTLGAGPCVDAIQDATPQLAPDLSDPDAPWPLLRGAVLASTPVRGMLGFRIVHQKLKVGALNLFSDRPGGFTDAEVDQASVVAAFCAVMIQSSLDKLEIRTLREGLASNREIGKAIGLLMAYHKIGDEEAFGILRTASNELNTKLATVADQIVAGHRNQLPG